MTDRTSTLQALLAERILVLDGAMGTMIQRERLTEEQFRGERFRDWPSDLRGNNDLLTLTRPDLIRQIHDGYLEAGADIISSNTFNSTATSLADYGMEALAYEMNLAAAKLAVAAARDWTARDPKRPRFVAGALGPTTKTASISPDVNDPGFRNVTFDQLVAAYGDALRGLMDGGVDIVLVETIFDTLNAKAALFAIESEFERRGERLPVIVSGTITDASGRTLSGQTAEAFYNSIRHARPLAVGLNCALGARELRPYVEELSGLAEAFMSCYPNAGLPNAFGEYDDTPESMASQMGEWARSGFLNIAGGCCGTAPEHIRAIAEAMRGVKPRALPEKPRMLRLSGLEPFNVGKGLAVRQRRRAHQRHRIQGLLAHGPRRPVRRGAGGGAPAGGERRPGDRRQHGRGDAGLGEGDDHLPQPRRLRAGHRARAGDGGFLEVERDRGRPEVPAGQGHRQFHQHEGKARPSSCARRGWCASTAPR